MILIQGLISLLSRSAGKVANAVFGWAVIGLFGRSSPREQAVLSGMILGAVLWPLLAIGVFAPRVVAFLIAFVPVTRSIPDPVLRMIWVALAIAIPAAIGLAFAAKGREDGPRESFWLRVARGFPLTLGLAAAFVLMFFTVPILRLASIGRRWRDEHVPLVTEGDETERAAERIEYVITRWALEARRTDPPWWMRAPTRILRAMGGPAVAASMPEDAYYWEGPRLRIALYPSDILVRGPKARAAWTHGLIAEAFARGPGLQTFDPQAKQLERQIQAIWRVLDREPREHAHSAILRHRIQEVSRTLAGEDIPYEEWQIVYRKIAQLARAVDAEPQLMEWAAREENQEVIMNAGERQVEPGRPLESASTKSLLGQLFHDASDLVKKELELARAEVREEVKGAIAKMAGMAVAGVCALVGVGVLCAAAVLGLAEVMAPWMAALLVAVLMFAIAGGVFFAAKSRTHGKPLERTLRTLKEDVRWAREQTA